MKRTKMLAVKVVEVVLLLQNLLHFVEGQGNPAFINDPDNINAQRNTYYFSSNTDCNKPIRNIFGNQVVIKGHDITSVAEGPSSCSIRLRDEGQFDGSILDIEVISMNILECTTQVAVYDGDGAQTLLRSYDCYSTTNQNRQRYRTSGNTATFMMTRQNTKNFEFDIEIRVTPARGGNVPGYENNYGQDSAFAFDKFPQERIVGMISGFYSLILVICIAVIVYHDLKFKGHNKEWETHQLATVKTSAGFEGKMPPPSNAWSTELQPVRPPASQYSRSTYPQSRKTAPRSEDGESDTYYNDDTFQKRQLMNGEREKPRQRYESSNASYTEDADDADHFIEKVITPRVRTHKKRDKRPPSYEEAVSEGVSDRSSDEEDEGSYISSSDNSVRKRPLSSEEERSERSSRSSRSRTTSATPSEEDSASDDNSHRGRGARARRPKSKPQKSRRRRSSDDTQPSTSGHPRQQKQPRQLQQQYLPAQQMQPMPYGAYPPGQFVPIMAGPPGMQPVQMVPGFPPPGYHAEAPQAAPPEPQIQPTDPPVYSYLVRRGYIPKDEQSNSVASGLSSQGSRGARLEEPEVRLDTGVEYMRR